VIVRTRTLAHSPHAGQVGCLRTVRKNTGTVRFWTWSYTRASCLAVGCVRSSQSGHHAVEYQAGLGAVKASALCADRYAASGLDRACAQLADLHLRDGREPDRFVHRRWLSLTPRSRERIL
jgi:hypothetical protein